MRIGTVCYATRQGLGYLARSFYDAGIVTDPIILSHSHYLTQLSWYKNTTVITQNWIQNHIDWVMCVFNQKPDIMLFFETPFNWKLIPYCRELGIKTVLMPMFECMPKVLPYQPDYFLCPSLLDKQYYPDRSEFIPVPIDTKTSQWKLRREAKVFVHNAGHGGLRNRNGTGELLDAVRLVKSPIKLIIRSQKRLEWSIPLKTELANPNITLDIRVGDFPYESLYDEGDVFVFPEKFNGLSLPLQEARAAGMVVMCGNRFPMNTWLPTEYLIDVDGYKKDCVSPRCNEFDSAIITPQAIANSIDAIYGKDITYYSVSGKTWRNRMSWESLKPRYTEFFEKVLRGEKF